MRSRPRPWQDRSPLTARVASLFDPPGSSEHGADRWIPDVHHVDVADPVVRTRHRRERDRQQTLIQVVGRAGGVRADMIAGKPERYRVECSRVELEVDLAAGAEAG